MRGYRSMLFVPLMSAGTPIGLISVTRKETGAFAAHHVQLVRTFADQAVIAIENARLFDEVQAKTRELSEALTYQTGSCKYPQRDRVLADRCRAGSRGHRQKRDANFVRPMMRRWP